MYFKTKTAETIASGYSPKTLKLQGEGQTRGGGVEYPLAAWVKCMEQVFRGCSKKGNKDCGEDLKE